MAVRDKCLFCGEPVSITGYCTSCKLKQDHLKKAFNTSIYHYNLALGKARNRDLSGALKCLQDSLRYNKQNINSRNLIGLIYFEMGELVLAMNHWVMSINYKSKNNPATEYLKQIRDDKKYMDDVNQSYIAFNQAYEHAKTRDFDLAILQLRKSLTFNKNFVKAYLLLSVLYVEKGRKGLAKKALSRVIAIDRRNDTAMRYLEALGVKGSGMSKMVDENSGRDELFDYYGLESENQVSQDRAPKKIIPVSSDGATRRQMLKRYREKNLARYSNLYVILGIVVGVAVLYLLIVPAANKEKSLEISQLRTSYSKDISAKNTEIDNLTSENDILSGKISDYATETDALNKKITDLEETVEALNKRLIDAGVTAGTTDNIDQSPADTQGQNPAGGDNPEGAGNPDGTDNPDGGQEDAAEGKLMPGDTTLSGGNENITGISVPEINTIINGE